MTIISVVVSSYFSLINSWNTSFELSLSRRRVIPTQVKCQQHNNSYNMQFLTIAAFSCVLLLCIGVDGRSRVFRQVFTPRTTTRSSSVAPTRPTTRSSSVAPTTPTPLDDGATPAVVDGNGSLLGCNCPAPPQFNPVCGSDGVTYGNLQKLYCAQNCGRRVRMAFMGACANGK
ncbi:hypothetical protein C0J52_20269 [Blattella germanica]|nr:hypothetical protein C0J52_20269 [Blattella germanica]